MSKHKFPHGHTFGGRKEKTYKTKQLHRRIPEDIFTEVASQVYEMVKNYELLNGHKKSDSLVHLKSLQGLLDDVNETLK